MKTGSETGFQSKVLEKNQSTPAQTSFRSLKTGSETG